MNVPGNTRILLAVSAFALMSMTIGARPSSRGGVGATTLGKRTPLAATLTGRNRVRPNVRCEWDVNISGGTPPYTSTWQIQLVPGGWTQPTEYGLDYMFYHNTLSSGDYMQVWVDVYDSASGHVQQSKHVDIDALTTPCLSDP